MHEDLYLIPSLAGTAVIFGALKFHQHKGNTTNRWAFGLALLSAALLWELAHAMKIVSTGKFYFMANALTVLIFFMGVACLLPPPAGATRFNQHRLTGHILIWSGMALGLAHSLALANLPGWADRVIEFYGMLGLKAEAARP